MLINHEVYCFIYKRASFEVYKKFRINKLELWLLCAIAAFLRHKNQTVISKDILFNQITGNGKEQLKIQGPFEGLVKGKFIGTYEYITMPGSCCIGLSELGSKTLQCYNEACKIFAEKFAESPYRLGMPEHNVEEPSARYRAKTA